MAGNPYNLDRLFYPRSVAVVGDKRSEGYHFLRSLKEFPGPVYSVQIDPNEIPHIAALGFPNYLSLLDIPGPVDLVIVAVPRGVTPRVVADCLQKQVGGVTLFTAGFAETGTEEGKKLQGVLERMAREGNLPLVGPNCMGLYHPKAGLRFTMDQWLGEGGNVALIAQSGTHLSNFSLVGPLHGVRVSLGVSFGNGIVLDSPDYLEYFGRDPGTQVIAMYIEGVKDGRRFVDALRAVAQRKPVVIWKGGITEEGTRATAAHTAALAESPTLWRALIRQCGAIPVASLEEMLDTVQGLLYIKPITGPRLGLISLSGGQSVAIADAFASQGLQVPPLSQASYQELATFFSIIGASYRNPFDINPAMLALPNLQRILGLLNGDENIDGVVLELSTLFLATRWERDPQFLASLVDALEAFKDSSAKPFLAVVIPSVREAMAMEARDRLVAKNIANYPSFTRAARALRRVVEYHRWRAGLAPLPDGGEGR